MATDPNQNAPIQNAQAMFDDARERTQDALGRGQQLFGEAAEFGRGNMDAVIEASRVAARGMESIGQSAAAYARQAMESAQGHARQLAGVANPAEFMRLQGDYARASFDSLVAETSRGTEAMLKLAGEVTQPLSNRMALAADRIKTAA